MGIQIHQLGARPGSLASSDDFAVDTGTATYRTPLSAVSDAVDGTGVTFTSDDTTLTPSGTWSIGLISSGETKKSLFQKLSRVVANVRWLVNLMGNVSISGIGDNTVTGAISAISSNAARWTLFTSSSVSSGTIVSWADLPNYNVFVARADSTGIGGVAVGIRWTATNIRWMCMTSATNGKCYMTSISWTLANDGKSWTAWTLRTDSSGTDGAPVTGLSQIYGVF